MDDDELLRHLTSEPQSPPPHPTVTIGVDDLDTVLALLLLYFEGRRAVVEVQIEKGGRVLGFLHRDVLYDISPLLTRAIGDLNLDLSRLSERLAQMWSDARDPSFLPPDAIDISREMVIDDGVQMEDWNPAAYGREELPERPELPEFGYPAPGDWNPDEEHGRLEHQQAEHRFDEWEEERRLQADVSVSATKARRRNAFGPGARHDVGLHIGPRDRDSIAASGPFPDSEVDYSHGSAELTIEFIAPTPGGRTERQTLPLLLPPAGPTSRVTFALEVPTDAEMVRASVLIFQGARLLQSVELRGPVSRTDHVINGHHIELVTIAEIVSTPTPAVSPAIDASWSFQIGLPNEALLKVASGQGSMISLPDMTKFSTDLIYLLRQAVAADAEDGAEPGSEQQVALMRALARRGNLLYQHLSPKLGKLVVKDSIQITTRDDDAAPLEFVYDYGYPSEKAKLCVNWQAALRSGRCTCRRRGGTVRRICPLGFWGLRFIVERLTASNGDADLRGQLGPHRTVLPDLRRVLFAASANVDKRSPGERERTMQLLQQRLGAGAADANSWSSWEQAIKNHRPGLLLTLPHNDRAEDNLPVLEIGKRSRLEVGGLGRRHVLARDAPVGPVVMLLGCTTAQDEVAWQSAAAAFRRCGATVVVGTLAETLGRQSAPMARMLADSLWGPHAVVGATMGEVMRQVRRRLVADGATLGMSLVAFGHTGWLVQQPWDNDEW